MTQKSQSTPLDTVPLLAKAPPLPEGCTCRYEASDTPAGVAFAWNRTCPVHNVQGDANSEEDKDA